MVWTHLCILKGTEKSSRILPYPLPPSIKLVEAKETQEPMPPPPLSVRASNPTGGLPCWVLIEPLGRSRQANQMAPFLLARSLYQDHGSTLRDPPSPPIRFPPLPGDFCLLYLLSCSNTEVGQKFLPQLLMPCWTCVGTRRDGCGASWGT